MCVFWFRGVCFREPGRKNKTLLSPVLPLSNPKTNLVAPLRDGVQPDQALPHRESGQQDGARPVLLCGWVCFFFMSDPGWLKGCGEDEKENALPLSTKDSPLRVAPTPPDFRRQPFQAGQARVQGGVQDVAQVQRAQGARQGGRVVGGERRRCGRRRGRRRHHGPSEERALAASRV